MPSRLDANLSPDTVCEAQVKELISVLASDERVIVMGDLNCKSLDTLRLFEAAGYTLGNDGSLVTCPTATVNRALDNIIVKGLKIENARTHETALSDHYAISAEVSLL